jgi:hypothetical protein
MAKKRIKRGESESMHWHLRLQFRIGFLILALTVSGYSSTKGFYSSTSIVSHPLVSIIKCFLEVYSILVRSDFIFKNKKPKGMFSEWKSEILECRHRVRQGKRRKSSSCQPSSEDE